MSYIEDSDRVVSRGLRPSYLAGLIVGGLLGLGAFGFFAYTQCRIEVPSYHMALLVRKTGSDLSNDEEIAPTPEHKGLQQELLAEEHHLEVGANETLPLARPHQEQ